MIGLCVSNASKTQGSDLARRTTKTTAKQNRRVHRSDEQTHLDNDCIMRVNVARLCESNLNKIKKDTLQFVVDTHKANDRQRQQVHQAFTFNSFLCLAFEYGNDIKYYVF